MMSFKSCVSDLSIEPTKDAMGLPWRTAFWPWGAASSVELSPVPKCPAILWQHFGDGVVGVEVVSEWSWKV